MHHTSRLYQLVRVLTGVLVVILCVGTIAHTTMAAETTGVRALLYVPNSKNALISLRAHISSMDTIAPQTYAARADGKLLGKPSTEVLKLAWQSGAHVMPLVVNQNFSQKGVHTFLSNSVAQDTLITSLITEAKVRGYIGYQYDFEHMAASDRDLYSAFVRKSAALLHMAGLEISVAVAPQHSDNPADYGDGSWQNWTGAFDYASIGANVDFISVMAYDDSKSVGPTAALPWVESVVAFTLKKVPAQKVSLGIPFYTWVRNDDTGKREKIVGYPAVAHIIESGTYNDMGWSDTLGTSWVSYDRGGKHLTAWYEDKRSFQEKMNLVAENKLGGFSAWALGLEDPSIWNVVLASRGGQDNLAVRY